MNVKRRIFKSFFFICKRAFFAAVLELSLHRSGIALFSCAFIRIFRSFTFLDHATNVFRERSLAYLIIFASNYSAFIFALSNGWIYLLAFDSCTLPESLGIFALKAFLLNAGLFIFGFTKFFSTRLDFSNTFPACK